MIKRPWSACLERIIYRLSKPAMKVLDILPEEEKYAKKKTGISEEIGYTTTHTGRLLEELEEAEADKLEETGAWSRMGLLESKDTKHRRHQNT